MDIDQIKKDHMEGKHFTWSNCPWCWAESQMREIFKAPMISSVILLLILSVGTVHAEPLACMSVGDLKAVTLKHAKLQASEKNLQAQVKAYLELDSIHKEKEAVQEQHIADQDQIIDAQAVVLSREQRLSRYKSEFVGLAAVVALVLWGVN